MSNVFYECGNVPMGGDLIEHGGLGTEYIVCAKGEHDDHFWIAGGTDEELEPHRARLIARHGEPRPADWKPGWSSSRASQ